MCRTRMVSISRSFVVLPGGRVKCIDTSTAPYGLAFLSAYEFITAQTRYLYDCNCLIGGCYARSERQCMTTKVGQSKAERPTSRCYVPESGT